MSSAYLGILFNLDLVPLSKVIYRQRTMSVILHTLVIADIAQFISGKLHRVAVITTEY